MTGTFVRKFGQGERPALLLHCSLAHSGLWTKVAHALGSDLNMVAPDFPSHGKSVPWDGQSDVHDASTKAMRVVLDDLPKPCHLIGHSFGATVALRLALQSPDHVASLTLIEPVFFAAAQQSAVTKSHKSKEMDVFAQLENEDGLVAAEMFNALWGGGMPWAKIAPQMQQDMARLMPFVAATKPSLWDDCHDMLAPGGLEQIGAAVTLIRGSATVPVIAEVHAGLAFRLKQARDVVIHDAGHMLTMTHAQQVAAEILRTVRSA